MAPVKYVMRYVVVLPLIVRLPVVLGAVKYIPHFMQINRANIDNHVEGKVIMELIAERDHAIAIAEMLHDLAEAATPKPERFSRNEIRYVSTIDINSVRKEADTYSKLAREIDNKIQASNWSIEVV